MYYQGKHSSASGAPRKLRPAALILSLVLILVLAVGGTVAFLQRETAAVENSFTAATAPDPEIIESFDGTVKSSVTVKNTGTAACYIRVMVVANTVDEDGNVTGTADVSSCLKNGADNWILGSDGYYYYQQVVADGQQTSELLSSAITLNENLKVDILAQAVQATPKNAVADAWGVTVNADCTISK